jgi:hypothetical protein
MLGFILQPFLFARRQDIQDPVQSGEKQTVNN